MAKLIGRYIKILQLQLQYCGRAAYRPSICTMILSPVYVSILKS